jgi:hypothetical protein
MKQIKNKGQATVPGHPDVDLCDLRNVLATMHSNESDQKIQLGIQMALNVVRGRIVYNELKRSIK